MNRLSHFYLQATVFWPFSSVDAWGLRTDALSLIGVLITIAVNHPPTVRYPVRVPVYFEFALPYDDGLQSTNIFIQPYRSGKDRRDHIAS